MLILIIVWFILKIYYKKKLEDLDGFEGLFTEGLEYEEQEQN